LEEGDGGVGREGLRSWSSRFPLLITCFAQVAECLNHSPHKYSYTVFSRSSMVFIHITCKSMIFRFLFVSSHAHEIFLSRLADSPATRAHKAPMKKQTAIELGPSSDFSN
jgi:hypothetical protein